jgi:hypothetical protein
MIDSDTVFRPNRLQRPVILDISQVRRSGLLAREDLSVELDVGIPLTLRSRPNGIIITFPVLPVEICEQFSKYDSRFWKSTEIDIVYRELQFGDRPYFVCPITGRDCLKLMIAGDQVYSKMTSSLMRIARSQALYLEARQNLLGKGRSRRLSALKRNQLVEAVRKHPGRFSADADLQRYLQWHEARENRARRRAKWESRPLSTTKALDEGRGLFQYPILDHVSTLSADQIAARCVAPQSQNLLRDSITRYPELDIKVLLARGTVSRARLSGRRLGWSTELTAGFSVNLFWGSNAIKNKILLILEPDGGTNHTWQLIDLLPGPTSNKPRYFICPITRARCETLYLREGRFASSQAQNLRANAD